MGIINTEAEPVVTIGAIVSDLPMVDMVDISRIQSGDYIKLDATQGRVTVIREEK